MIRKIRNSFWTKVVSVFLLLNLLGEIIFPTAAMALTSGPVSIDQASFEPAATSEMVDLATGDFTYNIPLMDVDGYPINIAYHGGVDMDQDASMVGLGWSLNVGALNRSVRGLPDDFSGDEVKTEMNLRPNYTVGGEIGFSTEFAGYENIVNMLGPYAPHFTGNIGVGVSFNNYVGLSTELTVGFNAGIPINKSSISIGMGASSNSTGGLTTTKNAGFSGGNNKFGISVGQSVNTAEGLTSKTVSANVLMYGGTKSIPVSTISYMPSIQFETNTIAVNYDFDLGLEAFWVFPHAPFSVYQNLICNRESVEQARSYGYMYMHNATPDEYLLDFNREGVVLANEYIRNLPVTNHTYDLFSATGQGLGFSFRPHRSDIGVVSEMDRESTINGVGVSIEAGFANLFEVGVNVDIPYGYTRTGKWTDQNLMTPLVKFVSQAPAGSAADNKFFEPFYFKKFGNRSGFDAGFYSTLGGTTAMEQQILDVAYQHIGNSAFVNIANGTVYGATNEDHYKTERDGRNTSIQYFNASQASAFALSETIDSYSLDEETGYSYSGAYSSTPASRYGTLSTEAKAHHLSEMTVLEGDGSRYVYGIPVINHKTREVTFNVSSEKDGGPDPLTKDCLQGLVTYESGDNTNANPRGDDNLFLAKELPAYASSYLLTAYLSSNYIDRSGNGPTPDDFGDYTKFNYSNLGTTKWRFPYELNSAAYNEGFKADPYDDAGSYVYGERDQWYIHSIESKNFVAEFHYTERHDGYGVTDENGGQALTNQSLALESIKLYTRKGKINNEPPIKTVHFVYDYTLCQSAPNNDGDLGTGQEGKLTLKELYFTYGNSDRGELHKYTFEYGHNKPYALGEEDRWGTYKRTDVAMGCASTDAPTNFEYPYSDQVEANADADAGAWMLQTIHLPSGSEINIETEADDYAYVQNVPATRMYKIRGFTSGPSETGLSNVLYADLFTPRNYLHVAMGEDLGTNATEAKTNFLANYLPADEIYFRMLVEVTPSNIPPGFLFTGPQYEYVSGYAKVDPLNTTAYDGPDAGTGPDCISIRLKDVSMDDELETPTSGVIVNPVSKASWQFTRKFLPKIINPVVSDLYYLDDMIPCGTTFDVPNYDEDSDLNPDPATQLQQEALQGVFNTAKSHVQNALALGGINFMMATLGYSSECAVGKSWVRLGVGDTPKLGGGHRVKQITVNDNWDDVSTEDGSTYGSKYTYQTKRGAATISSGVASYEPIISGSDENAMREPLPYTIDVRMRVNDEEFQEYPFGEAIFANPQVVYSEVAVENIDYTNVTQNATGKTIYEYYTAKDFPTIFRNTGDASSGYIKDYDADWMGLFSAESFTYLTMSQGFMIHVNDMHGKFKGKRVLPEQYGTSVPEPIYEIRHNYFSEESNGINVLDNLVDVVSETGVISQQYIGRDIDVVVDANEVKSLYGSKTWMGNIDASFIPPFPFPIPIPSVWYRNVSIENRYRSSVTTKVITSTGILKEVVMKDKGRFKSSENLLFDANTGVPIVTEINHEQPLTGSGYEQPIYQYDYPAYWIYEGMGLAAENWGVNFIGGVTVDVSDYKVTLANKELYLNPGDELSAYNNTSHLYVGKFWVVEDEVTGDYILVDQNGSAPTYNTADGISYRVIRSGKRNLLGSTAASVSSLTKYVASPYADNFTHTDVLNASAVEYTEKAFGYTRTDKDERNCGIEADDIVNPYQWGLRGNWNLLASYVYDYTRDQSTGNARIDGLFDEYVDFWENNLDVWEKNLDYPVELRWIRTALATIFDREGFNLESQDALGLYSSILLGYNNTIKIAEAVNSRYYQVGFDGFEDWSYAESSDCTTPHFRFTGDVSQVAAHTGRYSLLVPGTSTTLTSAVVADIYHTVTDHGVPYLVQEDELIPKHTFIIDDTDPTKYVLTFWARGSSAVPTTTSYNINVFAQYESALLPVTVHRSNIIDGWQRIEAEITFPADATPTGDCVVAIDPPQELFYLDDIRIQPYNSEMVSYVIDPITLRLSATLDSRNFATIYQYDEEGTLVRIMQETERGRITVQENRAGIAINP